MFEKSLSRAECARGLIPTLIAFCLVLGSVGCSCGKSEIPDPEMPRMLARLPLLPESVEPDENGFIVSFSNAAALKQVHGYDEELVLEHVPTSMMDEFLKALGPAGMCADLNVYLDTPRPRMDIGYDVMAVERCIEGGGVTVLEGDFDPQQVATSLEDLGYSTGRYEGVTTYHFDAGNYTGDRVGRELAEAAGHVAVLKKTIIAAATVERLRAALDAQAKRARSLSGSAQHVALAEALGPAVSAGFLPRGDRLAAIGYQEFTITESEMYVEEVSVAPPHNNDPLDTPGYVWSDRDITYHTRNIVLASIYGSADEAEEEGRILVENLQALSLAQHWREIGEPTVEDLEEGAILTIIIELNDDAPGGVPAEMLSVWPQD